MNNYNGFPGVPNDNDRTKAFTVHKKQRRSDSIGWILTALILFFLNIMSLGRITIVGQLLDDIIFTLPFGWFKYFLYLLFFIVVFAVYFGIKFKPKKRFLAMIFLTWIMFCWIFTSVLFICAYHINNPGLVIEHYWSKSILQDSIKSYLATWKLHSFFGNAEGSLLWSSPTSYFTTWAGGGLIGATLAGIFSYTTIYGSLIVATFFFFLNMMWIFTGNPFYFFKPKHKRVFKRLRILSLRGKNNNSKVRVKTKKGIFNIISIDEEINLNDVDIISSIKDSDITIELPSFRKEMTSEIYQQPDEKFYSSNLDIEVPKINNPINFDDHKYMKRDEPIYARGVKGYRKVVTENYDNVESDINSQKAPTQVTNEFDFDKQFLPRRKPKENFDYTIPLESKYGNVSTEEARQKFSKETSITPHGANGHTKEIIKELVKKPVNKEGPSQISLEDFINSSIEEKEKKNNSLYSIDDYTSPMEDIFTKSIINPGNSFVNRSNNNQTIEINSNKAVDKEIFVNAGYSLPKTELLNSDTNTQNELLEIREKAKLKAKAINDTFAQFGVKATVNNMNIGPSVTKFEVLPGVGTKVNSITSLENDLKLALANQNVRIEAPIQGKAAVGIEVPNDKAAIVPFRSVIENVPLKNMNSKLLFAIGKNVSGEMLFGELDKMPHLLVAGSTGSGKSVMINGIISSILMRSKPHEVRFLMIDPKKVELSIYSSIPHLLAPVISDMNLANSALKKVINEMERRYALFTSNSVKNIEGYNSKMSAPSRRLPYYVIIIDELADLMMTANKKDVEDSIMRLTQMARAAGIHLIVATQRPSTDVLTGVIKSNIPARIAFSVASSIDSRTILDSGGAEKLIGRGDLLYVPPGSSSLIRAQGSFISDEEIEKLVYHCSNQQPQIFDEEFMIEENEYNEYGGGSSSQRDPMFDEIRSYVVREQKASTSLLQRKFSIGYNRAAKIIDELEEYGVIGPQNGSKSREVYVKNEEL